MTVVGVRAPLAWLGAGRLVEDALVVIEGGRVAFAGRAREFAVVVFTPFDALAARRARRTLGLSSPSGTRPSGPGGPLRRRKPAPLVYPGAGERPAGPRRMRAGMGPDPRTSCVARITNALPMGKEFR